MTKHISHKRLRPGDLIKIRTEETNPHSSTKGEVTEDVYLLVKKITQETDGKWGIYKFKCWQVLHDGALRFIPENEMDSGMYYDIKIELISRAEK